MQCKTHGQALHTDGGLLTSEVQRRVTIIGDGVYITTMAYQQIDQVEKLVTSGKMKRCKAAVIDLIDAAAVVDEKLGHLVKAALDAKANRGYLVSRADVKAQVRVNRVILEHRLRRFQVVILDGHQKLAVEGPELHDDDV